MLPAGFLSMAHAAETVHLAAEDAELVGSVILDTTQDGYSGAGYLSGFDNSAENHAAFSFTAEAGLYDVVVGFSTPEGEKGYGLTINGAPLNGLLPGIGSTFDRHNGGQILLLEGENTASIGGSWGWYIIDYIEFIPAMIEPPDLPPRWLSNPDASLTTRNLHDYLIDLYGRRVLVGQQDLGELRYLADILGVMPALGSFDFIDYSPSRREHGTQPAGGLENSENWIEWHEENNGIVSLMWHWNAPIDLIDEEPDRLWWSGFYTHATTFDLAAALADPGGERFQLLMRDMDVIAEELKKFQQADIPVLWRPLHEAAGGWFWWGAAGEEAFIELWRLMYDRYTVHHDLDNLIWVYTHEMGSPMWYPGDSYVDIVGIDIYSDLGASMSGQWQEMTELFGGKKLLALTESGTPPEGHSVRTHGTWWSWFSLWVGEGFIRGFDEEYVRSVYLDNDYMNAPDLAPWRNYHLYQPLSSIEMLPSFSYELQVSTDLMSWETIPFPLPGAERVERYTPDSRTLLSDFEILTEKSTETRFYRVVELP